MTKIIGLTGGIGSGKSTVAKLFEAEAIPVYYADDASKQILDLPETISSIVMSFGSEVVVNKKIDKKKLASIVFNDPEKLKILNNILHPLVKKNFDKWLVIHNKYPFVVKEAAILFESGSYKYCDIIITVSASLETRINRVMERDKCSKESVLDRINNQWKDEDRIAHSDFVIINENYEQTTVQYHTILKKIKNLH